MGHTEPASVSKSITTKDLYEEAGRNYRHFLGWRHALFGGYLAVLAAIGASYMWTTDNAEELRWVPFVAAIFLSFLFFFLDLRTTQLLYACVEVGAGLERENGVYARLDEEKGEGLRITWTLWALYSLVVVASIVGLALLWRGRTWDIFQDTFGRT